MAKYKQRNGVHIPESMKIRSWVVTGTPGCGKTWLMEKIHGVPGEICIDVAMKKWWKVPPLAQRPREVHLSLPFEGHRESHPVYEDIWTGMKPKNLPDVAVDRIRIPKNSNFFLAPDWRARFVFDFILPPPQWTWEMRRKRFARGDRKLVDVGISEKLVAWQVRTLWTVAWHFHVCGLQVLVRPFNIAWPYSFPEIVRVLRKKPKKGGGSVFPKGVDIGVKLTVADWVGESAPPKWRKTVAKGGKTARKNA